MSVKSKPSNSKLFTLRFRAKIILGFVAVLAILAASMAFAYFGFERIAGAVASYRTSVAEADLARTDFSSLRVCISGGAPMPAELREKFQPAEAPREAGETESE